MRINHNIAALNTYNKLSANQASTAKSLEKLSSGLKINKAGDNAAGLAISEKMRGQIRGLDQASTNANDGISLINTAEGALSETHSILQRMRELAVQSSNDTNVTVDRGEIQKEMNQLTSEINRIGNTTEFNTQKLLNGGGIETAVNVNTITAGAGTGGVAGGDAMGTANNSGISTITFANGIGAGTTGDTGSLSFQGVTINFVTTSAAAAIDTSSATENSITINIQSGTAVDNSGLATLVASGLNAIKAEGGLDGLTISQGTNIVTVNAGLSTQLNGATVSVDSGSLTTLTSAGTVLASTSTGNGIGAGNFDISTLTTSVEGVAQVNTSDSIDDALFAESGTASYTFKGVTVNVTYGAAGSATTISDTTSTTANLSFADDGTDSGLATAIASAYESIKAQGGSSSAIKDFDFTASTDTIVMTAQTKTDAYADDHLMVSFDGGAAAISDTISAGLDEVRGSYTFSIDTAFEAAGTKINIEGQTFEAVASNVTGDQFLVGTDPADQAASLAQAMNSNEGINTRYDVLVDGNKITLTEKAQQANGIAVTQGTITGNVATAGISQFSIDKSVAVGGKYEIDDVKIEVTDDATDKGIADGTKVLYSADTTQQATNLANAINANSTLNTKYEPATSTGNTIELKQKPASASMEVTEVLTGTNANDGFEANFQIGANTAQSLTIEVKDMRSAALGVAGKTAGGDATAKNGSVASFTATKDITDGTTNTGVEYALDVSTHEKATAAISVINDAIESVSAERSKLGSYQNRLEHTINNLGTSSENLTTAESRIRDVDMAKEMMEFTKNNILSQAAQSMLAQANQQPQGVLQLLG